MQFERSRGRQLLIVVAQRSSATEIAARLRVDKAAVSRWLSGDRTPALAARLMLATVYGIPPDAWHQPGIQIRL